VDILLISIKDITAGKLSPVCELIEAVENLKQLEKQKTHVTSFVLVWRIIHEESTNMLDETNALKQNVCLKR